MLNKILKKVFDLRSLRTNKKLIIITSDDWGSLRVKSAESQKRLNAIGIDTDKNRFDKYDAIENNDDLTSLFESLTKFKDFNGNHPVITAVTNVGNPDFDKIRANNFGQYYFEDISTTFSRYPGRDNVLSLYREGIQNNIFVPESHGREHLQYHWWMQELQDPNSVSRRAFDEEYFFIGDSHLNVKRGYGLGSAFNIWDDSDRQAHPATVASSLQIFEKLFGYKASHFTPPAMHHDKSIEPALAQNGVYWLDQPRWQKMPTGQGQTKNRFHYLGQKGSSGLRYLVRNCVFESNISATDDGVDRCLADIQNAFDSRHPAIISNHRASFVGGIDVNNRKTGLLALEKLIDRILKKWPDAEFIAVNQLKDKL